MRDGVHQAPGPAGLMDPPDLEDPAPLRLMNQEFPFGLMLTFKALLTSPSYAIEGIPFFLRSLHCRRRQPHIPVCLACTFWYARNEVIDDSESPTRNELIVAATIVQDPVTNLKARRIFDLLAHHHAIL